MDEMIRYIFGSLRCSETAISVFGKALKHQKSFNRGTVIFAVAASAHMLIQNMAIRSMQNKIESLKSEIKELKNTEGD